MAVIKKLVIVITAYAGYKTSKKDGWQSQMIKCPKCKLSTGLYYRPAVYHPELLVRVDYPLYQRSYGEEGYISPRCSRCFDKKERRSK